MQNLLKSISLVAILMISFKSNSQRYFYPDFTEIKRDFKGIDDARSFLNCDTRFFSIKNYGHVIIKRFSQSPSILCLNKGVPESALPLMIKDFNVIVRKYIEPESFELSLERLVNSEDFNKEYMDKCMDKAIPVDTSGSIISYMIEGIGLEIGFSDNKTFEYYKFLPTFYVEKNKTKISDFNYFGGDYDIGFSLNIYNYDKRIIKYTLINFSVYNPVGDLLATKSVRGIGYIAPMEGSNFRFKSVLYSSVASYIKINSISIQYSDGTKRVIPKGEVSRITEIQRTKYDDLLRR